MDQQELGWGWEGAGAAWRLSQSLVLSAEHAAGSKEFMEVLMLWSMLALLLLLRLHRASCFPPFLVLMVIFLGIFSSQICRFCNNFSVVTQMLFWKTSLK